MINDILRLRARFFSEWTGAPAFYDGQPDADPDNSTPWVRFSVRAGEDQHRYGSTASGRYSGYGRVWLQVFFPKQTGDAQALALVEQFLTIFQHWRSDDHTIRCAMGSYDYGFDDDVNMIAVTVPYESFHGY